MTDCLARYSKVWNKYFKPLNAFNCGIGGDRVENVLWRAYDLRCFSSLRNVIMLCGTNNLYHDSPEDVANGLIKIASCFKQGNNAIVFICDILPRDGTSSINRQLIKETNNNLKVIMFRKPYQFYSSRRKLDSDEWLP